MTPYYADETVTLYMGDSPIMRPMTPIIERPDLTPKRITVGNYGRIQRSSSAVGDCPLFCQRCGLTGAQCEQEVSLSCLDSDVWPQHRYTSSGAPAPDGPVVEGLPLLVALAAAKSDRTEKQSVKQVHGLGSGLADADRFRVGDAARASGDFVTSNGDPTIRVENASQIGKDVRVHTAQSSGMCDGRWSA